MAGHTSKEAEEQQASLTFPTQVMPLGIQVSAGYRETAMVVTLRGHPVTFL